MKKIMIIDDELVILDVLNQFLSRSGKYEIETYSNPDFALQHAKNGNYDLILSDIMMPSTSGMDILEEVKKTNPSIKVILMTAYSNQHKIEHSKDLGVDKYLEKPFKSLQDVENAISSLI
jgi:DNA-binding NtrC family response regulator